MNILLLYPAFPETFWGFQHAIRFIRKKSAYPPLGDLAGLKFLTISKKNEESNQ